MSYELQEISALRKRVEVLEQEHALVMSVAGDDIKSAKAKQEQDAAEALALQNFELTPEEKKALIAARRTPAQTATDPEPDKGV